VLVTVRVKVLGDVMAVVPTPTPFVAPPLTSTLPIPPEPITAEPPVKEGMRVTAAPYRGLAVEGVSEVATGGAGGARTVTVRVAVAVPFIV
jgi:hypothetical protein